MKSKCFTYIYLVILCILIKVNVQLYSAVVKNYHFVVGWKFISVSEFQNTIASWYKAALCICLSLCVYVSVCVYLSQFVCISSISHPVRYSKSE